MSVVSEGKVHTGDAGTNFELEILVSDGDGNSSPKDLTGATAEMIFTDPSGDEFTFDATVKSPPTDGVISYTNTDETFFNDNSFWFYRSKITQAGTVFQSNDASFEVLGKQQ